MQGEFDVAEMSTATLMRAKEKGKRFLALPVFFQRGPRQRNIFYCEGKLKHPSELKGKQIGAFRYGATAVSWARGYLLDEHGIKTTDVSWENSAWRWSRGIRDIRHYLAAACCRVSWAKSRA